MREQLCKVFCDNLSVRKLPIGYAVSTAFTFPDGDRVGFYIRNQPADVYRLEDNGVVIPLLEAIGANFRTGTRATAMNELLAEYSVAEDPEAKQFVIDNVSEDEIPGAAVRFVAFLLRVHDFKLMSEMRTASTFREDVRRRLMQATLTTATAGRPISIDENKPVLPTLQDFRADFILTAPDCPPVAVYLGTGDARVLEALYVKMQVEYENHSPVSIVALLEKGKSISAHVRQQAVNRLAALPEFVGDEDQAIHKIISQISADPNTVH
ncbi:MAG TPA: DUF1828 domain-containing protein [Candidatus Cybelea sp.]|nr:DUF1828 domain-containing protein [Candidatus Cybelea sp.]